MMVEMAVCLPVMLAVLGIVVNMLVFFGDCARFDRIAAEAVRSQAASPGYDAYGSTSRAQAVQSLIQASFADSDHLSFSVSASGGSSAGSATDGSGVSLSLLPHLETYTCRMDYRPWGFGGSFFGISFAGIPHTRVYVIDPYRPGVLL
jgi:hypothetical protein